MEDEEEIVAEVLLQADAMHDGLLDFAEICSDNAVQVDISRSNDTSSGKMVLSTHSDALVMTIEFIESSDAVIEFACSQQAMAKYSFKQFRSAFRGIHMACETFIRMSSRGILLVQHMVESADGGRCFVDAILLPQIPDSKNS